MKAFRLTTLTLLLVCLVLPTVMGTFGAFRGGRNNPMHAIMRPFMRMGRMLSNSLKKGMRGLSGAMRGHHGGGGGGLNVCVFTTFYILSDRLGQT